MKENILDTISFLTCCRETLCDIVDKLDLTQFQKNSGKLFLTNEATDFQILHLIYEGKLPKTENDKNLESKYIELSNRMMHEFETLHKSKVEFVPLSEFKLTSNPSVLGFLVENNLVSEKLKLRTPWSTGPTPEEAKRAGKFMLGATAILAGLGFLATKAAKRYLTQAGRTCGHLKFKEKQECIKKFKVNALKAKISILERGKSKCAKCKDPEKCRLAIDDKIDKVNAQIKALERPEVG